MVGPDEQAISEKLFLSCYTHNVHVHVHVALISRYHMHTWYDVDTKHVYLNVVQAQARCHRIGQNKPVKVYRLITRNSYEREMFDRLALLLLSSCHHFMCCTLSVQCTMYCDCCIFLTELV